MSEKATAGRSAGAEPSAEHAGGSARNLIIQPKLTIGSPNDHYEQQADQVADRVMQMPVQNDISGSGSFSVQRKCAACAHEEEQVQRKPFDITPFIQKSGTDGRGIASNAVSGQIESARGGGSPMGESTRSFMESRFGNDFSGVKIHTDSNAIQLSQNLNANAFTVGNDVFFNEGKYNPESDSGKHLLAHELVHTVQQGGSKATSVQRDGMGDVRIAEGYHEIIDEINATDVYKKLTKDKQKLVDEIIGRIEKVYADWPNRLKFIRTLKSLFVLKEKAPAVVSTETRAATTEAVKTEAVRLSKPAAKKNLDLEEKASADKKRKWTAKVGKFGGGTYYVDTTDSTNIVLKAKVHLKPTGAGTAADVTAIKSMEDAIEKHASTKGYIVDITFVDKPDAETFVANVDTSKWETATNWSGGDPKGFAHEFTHMLAFEIDRYNYIDSHATNESMVVEDRLHWFNEQLKKPLDWDNEDSLMASGDHPLNDDVCRIAGLDMKTCLEARKGIKP